LKAQIRSPKKSFVRDWQWDVPVCRNRDHQLFGFGENLAHTMRARRASSPRGLISLFFSHEKKL
ncbi:MAG: hypothetical protein AAGU11_06575, partial [Syntrophobacteraceae bacterium]